MRILLSLLVFFCPLHSALASPLDGEWVEIGSGVMIELVSFQNQASFQSTSYYENGAAVNWSFKFQIPISGLIKPNQLLAGTVRSQDGYYGCTFMETAQAMLDEQGHFKVHYPLLTYQLQNGHCQVTGRNWVTNLFEKL